MLTDAQVDQIRERFERGEMTPADLEALVGANTEAIRLRVALLCLLEWAEKANQRLAYELDHETGEQFGGNPYCNPTFKRTRKVLDGE